MKETAPLSQNNPNSFRNKPYTFDRVVRMLITLALFAGVIWLIDVLHNVLLPFVVAWLVAYILEPFVQYNRRLMRIKGRALAVLMTLFECLLLVCVLFMFLVPSVTAELTQVSVLLDKYAIGSSSIPLIPASVHEYLRNNIDFIALSKELSRQDFESILDAIGGVVSGGFGVVMWVLNCFITILYIVFIMLDYEKLIKGIRRMVPPKYRKATFHILRDVKTGMNHYFRGQALVALIVGICFSIGFIIVGLPLAVILGMFIGLLNLVPYLQLISLIPTTLLCIVYTANSSQGFWEIWWSCMAVYIVVQCIQDLFLTPKIMGKAMGLNPAIILLSLSVWGTLLGFIGLIIALPLTTLLLSYYDRYITSRESRELYREITTDDEV